MTSTVRSASVRLTMENASYIRGANQAAATTEAATGRMKRSVRSAAASTGRDWEAMGKYGGRYALAVGAGLAAVVKTTADFSSEMALVRTLSHANTNEMSALSKAALTVGQNIGYSAKEVAAGEEEMIKAGVSVKDILGGGLKGALDLAAAGQTDVATATTIAASAMTQFKLKGKDIPHLADLLSAGADKALGSVEDLGYGLEQSGTTAHQMGLSVEQTVGTLAAFAQAGLIGERGGTTFKQMLLQLSAPTAVAQKLMDKLHISLYDANGQIKTMPALADNLRRSLSGLTPAQRNAALGTIFGSRAIQGANILMADGRTEIAKWISKVNDQGFAAGQASGKLDSLSGDVKKFKATLSTTFIQAGSPSQTALRGLVQDADHLVKDFADLPASVQQGVVKVLALTTGIGATLYAISKVRTIARDLGGYGGKTTLGRGALGRAASLSAPVPVYVTNIGAGGLGGGGTTILGKGGVAAGGKLKGFAVPRGTGLVLTAAGLVLMATGVTQKTHTGSTVGGAVAGGQLFGPLGAAFGATTGAAIDILHSGNSASDALTRGLKALNSHDLKEQKAALADLRTEIDKLQNGGSGQNFNRFVTAVSGRGPQLLEVEGALSSLVETDKKAQLKSLRFLLDPNYKGGRPNADKVKSALDDLNKLLNPDRHGGTKHPKEMTSEDVLAQLYGINPKKLKPVNLLDQIIGVFGTGPAAGPGHKNAVDQFAASLGLDTSKFDNKAKGARHTGAQLNAMRISPKITADTSAAFAELGKFGAYLTSLTRPRSVNVGVHIHKGSVGAGGSGDLSTLLTPADGVTVPGSRGVYGDRVPALLAPTEEVISNRHGQADRWRPLLKAINANRMAAGGTVGGGSASYTTAAGITVYFPTPAQLGAAVAAADKITADAVKVARSADDIRQQGLDDLHTQQQIRDLQKELHARNKKHRLELRGLDRQTAKAELADAKAQLVEIRNQAKKARDDARKEALADLAQKRTDATSALTASADIFAGGTSAPSAVRSVDRTVADISEYGTVMSQLKAAKASPALLQQLINRANDGDFRSAIRLGKALLANPATLGQLNQSLATLGAVSSGVATMTTDPRFLSSSPWNPAATAATKVVQINLGQDPTLFTRQLASIIRHEVEVAFLAKVR